MNVPRFDASCWPSLTDVVQGSSSPQLILHPYSSKNISEKKNEISDTTLRNIAAYKGNLMAGMKFSSGTLTSFPFLVIPILVDSKPSNLCRNEPCFMQQHTAFYCSPLGEISICSCVARRVPDMHQLINPGPSRPLNS